MKKLSVLKLISLIFVCVMLIGAVAVTALATEGENTVELKKNIILGDKIQLMFAVPTTVPEDAEIAVTWGEDNDLTYTRDTAKDFTGYRAYVINEGWAAQNINAMVTITVTDGEDVYKLDYSILMYVYEVINLDNRDETNATYRLCKALLEYAKVADEVINKDKPNNLDQYYYVSVENATLDGFNTWGMFAKGATPFANIESTVVAGEGEKVQWTYVVNGTPVVTDSIDEVKALAVTGNITVSAAVVDEEVVGDKILATFDFGANGTASHNDGTEITTANTYTDGDYTLEFTNLTKVYGNNTRDANGNSCLKFGTGSVAGSMTFTVPADVDKVVILVAGYKSTAAKVSVNGGEAQTISTMSNDGDYTAVEVDTTVNKTVTFATVSGGYRCMINTILFVDVPGASGEQPEETEAPEATTEAPEATTEAPEVTTEAPEATTEAVVDPEEPVESEEPVEPEEPADPTPITASKTVEALITEYGWTGSTTKQSFNLDENVFVKINGGANTGKAYSGNQIRIYATDSPAGSITISVPEGYELVSVTITANTSGTIAHLYVGDTKTDIVNVTTAVSGSSVVLNSVKNGSNGKQIQVTGFEVVYQAVGQ